VTELGQARTGEEVLKLRFEFFKHMTTVSTASTAVVIAIYGLSEKTLRDAAALLAAPRWVFLSIPLVAIGGFFLSLLLSLWGLYLAEDARYTGENSAAISRMLKWSAAAFVLGVGISVVTAALIVAGPATVVALLGSFVALAGLIGTIFSIRNRQMQSVPRATTDETVDDGDAE
jgi:hypothetical protein